MNIVRNGRAFTGSKKENNDAHFKDIIIYLLDVLHAYKAETIFISTCNFFIFAGRGDFVGGIDNEALDFSQLEDFINSDSEQVAT